MAISLDQTECTGCGTCVDACSFGSITIREGKAVIDDTCTACGACVEGCPSGAIKKDVKDRRVELSRFKDVWVVAELKGGKVRQCTFELLGCGRGLADVLGHRLCALLAGKDVKGHVPEMAAGGADVVYTIEDAKLDEGRTLPHARVISESIRDKMPAVVLFSATPFGRDRAPRISRRLAVGLTADCTELSVDKETRNVLQTRPAWGGNLMATIYSPDTRPQMSTVRPGVMKPLAKNPGKKAEVIKLEYLIAPKDLALELLELKKDVSHRVNLCEAKIIVAGGNGVGSKEGFKELEELAKLLGAEVAGTRIAVEEGWITQDRQVGQTGQSVSPELYFACGISGAIQHRSGMAGSKTIVAVNSDPNAPIFGIADIGMVGDLHKVIPEMIKAIKERRSVQ
jgi:electron transfer flavoprotein alpha subunit